MPPPDLSSLSDDQLLQMLQTASAETPPPAPAPPLKLSPMQRRVAQGAIDVGHGLLTGGPIGAMAGGAKGLLDLPSEAGGYVTDLAAKAGASPSVSAGLGTLTSMIPIGGTSLSAPARKITEAAVKYPVNAAHAVVEPLYEGGQANILSRALASAIGQNRPQVVANLRNAQELVPGSLPTAAEAGQSGGLAAVQRAASAVDPESYATRAAQQNEARVKNLLDLAGTQGQRGSIAANRDVVANALYAKAREQGIDQGMAQELQPQMKNLMERMPSGVMEKAKELARLNGDVMGSEGSLNGLHWTKTAVDDMLSSSKQTGMGKQTERALAQYKNDLLSVIDELSPAYASARTTYQTMSKPIGQMDIAQGIADKSVSPLTGVIKPEMYARALSDDMAAKATGFNKATLENTLEPKQLAQLNAIKNDLARSVMSRDLGRGAGSDTTQKLAMTNLMQKSGLPMGVVNLPGIGRMGDWLYQRADDQMRQRLAKVLLDPKETAKLLERVHP